MVASTMLLTGAIAQAPPEPERLFQKISPSFTSQLADELRPFAKIMTDQKTKAQGKKARIELVGLVQLRADLLRPAPAGAQKSLLLNLGEALDVKGDLPGGLNVSAPLRSAGMQVPPGEAQWLGVAKDMPGSAVSFSYVDGAVIGSIKLGGTTFRVRPAVANKGVYLIEKINLDAFPNEGAPVPRQPKLAPEKKAAIAPVTPNLVDGCTADQSTKTVRVLFLYTDLAEHMAGSAIEVTRIVKDVVGQANVALRQSKVRLRIEEAVAPIKLAAPATEPAVVRPPDDLVQYLHNLADSPYIEKLKKQHGARAVTLLDDLVSDYASCGRGYVMQSTSERDTGYNIVDLYCAWYVYSFIHELGHNLGAGHNKDSGEQSVLHLYNYSFGQRWGGKFRTIMAYGCGEGATCERVDRFTNPSLTYNDIRIGDPASADNARTLNATRCFFAD
jgi:hypothetical protein